MAGSVTRRPGAAASAYTQLRALIARMQQHDTPLQARLITVLTTRSPTGPILSTWFIHVTWIIRNVLAIPEVGMYGTQILG
jgi:hypothetical protein